MIHFKQFVLCALRKSVREANTSSYPCRIVLNVNGALVRGSSTSL